MGVLVGTLAWREAVGGGPCGYPCMEGGSGISTVL